MLLCLLGLCCAWSANPSKAAAKPAGDSVQISVMGLPDPINTSVIAIADRAVLRAFYDKVPGIEIDPFSMPEMQGGSSSDTGPLLAIAAGMPPNSISVNFRRSSTYLSQGFLKPVEVLLARVLSDNPDVRRTDDQGQWVADPTPDEIASALKKIKDRTPGPAWEVIYREDESGQYPGKHAWAVPTSFLVQALIYRKDLFAAAGLDPNDPPKTWEELLKDARALTVPRRRQIGMVFNQGYAFSYAMYNLLASTGMRAVQRDENGTWRATFGTRGAAQATYFAWRMLNEPYKRDGEVIPRAAKTGGSEINLAWSRGKVGMRFTDLDQEILGSLNPQLVGIAPPPIGPNGQRASLINCRMQGVYAESTPQRRLATMRYIWFITSEQAQRIRTRIYVDNGFGQFVSPDLLKKFGYDRVLQRVPPRWQEVFNSAKKAGVPEPYGRNTQNIYRYMSEPLNEAMSRDYSGVSRDAAIKDIHGLLKESEDKVNQKVLGNISDRQWTIRRIVGGIVMLAVLAAFLVGFVHIWRYFGRVSASSRITVEQKLSWTAQWRRHARKYLWGYILLIPAMSLAILWLYVPLGAGLVMAFTDYRIVLDSSLVGVDNFATVLFDERFWNGLWHTFLFVALMVGLGFWPPILLALLLDEIPTEFLKYTFRTIFYLPAIISGIIVMFLWKELYDPSPYGALNQIYLRLNDLGPIMSTAVKLLGLIAWGTLTGLMIGLPIKLDEMNRGVRLAMWAMGLALLGLVLKPVVLPLFSGNPAGAAAAVTSLWGAFDLRPLAFIKNPGTAMFWVVVPTVWMTAGPGCLIYLAALKTIPRDLYEAASIDGAGNWHKVFYVTLPRLKYLIVIQFIFAVVSAFKGGTDFILAMTGGGPNNSTMILALEIFIRTFFELDFGVGAAMAWILGALLIGFTAYQMKLLAKAEFTAAK